MSRSSSAPRSLACAALLALGGCKASVSMNLESPKVDTSLEGRTAVTTRPAGKARIVRAGDKLAYEGGEIEFATGSAELVGESTEDVLDRLGEVLQQYPSLTVRIEGHTDSRGGRDFNQKLSDERARSIKTALVRRGVAGARLTSEGFGEDKPERPEPAYCHNRSEETVPRNKLAECRGTWDVNRRAAFVVTEGADTLPTHTASLHLPPAAEATPKPVPRDRRLDWALRLFGGYTLATPGPTLHGGHLGVGVHASQRFGRRERGYIGGGPRLHYRGMTGSTDFITESLDATVHQFGPEGNLLLGGGSKKVVGLFSLRLGLGMSAIKTVTTAPSTMIGAPDTVTRDRTISFAGWLLGGLVVLGKLTPRWSLGGHVEAGITRIVGPATFVLEAGLNVAWHFGRGRRDGI